MSRVLITGAAGFLGRHLCNELLRRGDFVVGVFRDQASSGFNWGCSAFVGGGFPQVERAIAEYDIDTVMHLAAQVQVSTAVVHPEGTFNDNVAGTWQVLEACRRQYVPYVVVASSDKVYGDGPGPYKEDQPLLASGIYATSKAAADLIAQSYAREFHMNIGITRCGNLYGPGHMNWSTLIPGTIRSVLRGERPRLRSNGSPRRDFLFVEDAVDAYLRLAKAGVSGAFNFGADSDGIGVYAVVKKILELMGSDLEPLIEVDHVAVEIQNQTLDSTKALDVLGWRAAHTLEQGLLKTIEWYRNALKGNNP